MLITTQYLTLGRTEIRISPIGQGIMQWGDIKFPGQPELEVDNEIRDEFYVSLANGINFFDTAEMYGNGRSEIYLGRLLKGRNENIVIATKFMPFPWRFSKGELRTALLKSLKRLGLIKGDFFKMHWPFPPVPIKNLVGGKRGGASRLVLSC